MDDLVVETTDGRIRGRRGAHGDVWRWAGIPYAAPPIGSRRWRAPGRPPPWPGVRAAEEFGPVAIQARGILETLLSGGGVAMSEDCLTLNVWTPAPDGGRRPVLFWIHGGGFTTGSGSIAWYDGQHFARHGDVVVVTCNYRLGALGFLHLGPLGGEEWAPAGNCGLLDQLAALTWVRDNIASFGGDPTNVTVFGESAGAMSIGALLGAPAARGLFRRAILQSGACANVASAVTAVEVAEATLLALDLGSRDLAQLWEVPPKVLLDVQEGIFGERFLDGLAYQPVIDGAVLPEAPLDAVMSGSASGVDLLAGTTQEEWKLFTLVDRDLPKLDDDGIVRRTGRKLGRRAADVVEVYRRAHPDASAADLWVMMATDQVFRVPMIRLLDAHHATGGRSWSYLFTARSTAFGGLLGSCHALDIPFVFRTLDKAGVELFTGVQPDGDDLSARIQGAWVSFARDGTPHDARLPDWPRYDPHERQTMRLGSSCEVIVDPAAGQHLAWNA